MQVTENSQLNLDYAKEWIAFLQRRNLILTIIWPILLTLFILSLVLAIYYYQSEQIIELKLSTEAQINSEHKANTKELLSQLEILEQSKLDLQTQLETLHSAREALSLQNNDSESKLTITSQMVDNLNQLVAELKNERASLISKLKASQTELENRERFVVASKKKNTQSISDLKKQIISRKSAYFALANRQQEMREEMDRLSDLVSTTESQYEKTKKENKRLYTQLKNKENKLASYTNQLDALQARYSELETKLTASMSPVGVKKAPLDIQAKPFSAPNKSANMSGLEEIKKPSSTQKSTDKNLDFNQISIMP